MHFLSSPASVCLITASISLSALGSTFSSGQHGPHNHASLSESACAMIEKKISSASAVYYPGQPNYEKGVAHWAVSSAQRSKCVVEPGKDDDVATIMKIIRRTRSPFAVKGGGHTSNPGFSSTTGVHISMTRFSNVKYQGVTKTVEVGMGLLWDDVYAALEPYNRTVVGGRVSGVGVAGLSLGGGYSWKTNQHGLTIDTIEAFQLVKPDGTITKVTHASQPELFFGLKGTQNNFGIVTKITFKTFPQTAVWGGRALIPAPALERVAAATAAFHDSVRDPKASMLVMFGIMATGPIASVLLFYDGPTPPPGIFDSFLSLPMIMSDLKTRSYLSLVQSSSGTIFENPRGLFQALPHPGITPQFVNATLKELVASGQSLTTRNNTFIGLTVEPFLLDILQHTNLPSAYPASRTTAYLPFNLAAAWPDAESDSVFYGAMKGMGDRLRAAAISQGQAIPQDAPMYPNYALYDTPLEHVFGANLPKLRRLKKKVDPENVMGLAGGFKL